MRPTDADRFLLAYLAAREQRYSIRSPSLSITGWTSSCCKAETFERFGILYCYRCRQRCKEHTWIAPRNGEVSRGGWDRILVRETRCVDGDGEYRRRWQAWIEFEPLERLFARPAASTEAEWKRVLSAWSWFAHPEIQKACRTSQEACVRAASEGLRQAPEADEDQWTADLVWTRVGFGRQIVVNRLTDHPGRYRLDYVRTGYADRIRELFADIRASGPRKNGDRAA